MKNILDLHTHSVLSKHAYSSVTENIDYALRKGLKYLGVSEHQYDPVGVGAHYFGVANLSTIPSVINGLHILKGVELNILEDGTLDLERVPLHRLDYGIASMHRYIYDVSHTKEENTRAYQKACEHPFVRILGHIDRDGYPCDYRKVIETAVKTRTLIELNNSSLSDDFKNSEVYRRDLEILSLCKEMNCPVILNSDAHICYDVGNFERSFSVLKESGFPLELVLNFNEALFLEYFGDILTK